MRRAPVTVLPVVLWGGLLGGLAGGPAPAPAQEVPVDPGQAEELMRIERDLSGVEQIRDRARAKAAAAERAVLRLQRELVAAGARAQALEQAIADAGDRLDSLHAARAVSQALLARRSAQLIEALAALQRLDLEPPPALLVSPQDALTAARGAMMLGTLVPELRGVANELSAQIETLDRLAREIAAERAQMARDRVALDTERRRIDELLVAREEERRTTRSDAARAQARYEALTRKAKGLRDLLGRLEADVPTVAALRPGTAPESPADALAGLRGALPAPVVGRIVEAFGAEDGAGGIARGVSMAAAPGAQVISPADGEIVFAGPFRSYGKVLIIMPGNDYLIVLAGLEEIYGTPGQRLLAGEPVGRMPGSLRVEAQPAGLTEAPARAGEAGGSGGDAATRPVLYIEMRRAGTPVDPAQWIRLRPRPA